MYSSVCTVQGWIVLVFYKGAVFKALGSRGTFELVIVVVLHQTVVEMKLSPAAVEFITKIQQKIKMYGHHFESVALDELHTEIIKSALRFVFHHWKLCGRR